MRAKIVEREAFNGKQIQVHRTKKEMNGIHSLVGWYENPKEREGVIFGRIVMSGDRMDAWASHVYHIAIKKSGRGYRILGWLECEYGWQGTYYRGVESQSPKTWKRVMIERANDLNSRKLSKETVRIEI